MKMGVNGGENDELASSTSKMDLEMLQKIFMKGEPNLIIDSYEVSFSCCRAMYINVKLHSLS